LAPARQRVAWADGLGESSRLGKPQPFISSIEKGVRRVDLIEFYAIARALKQDPEVLFGAVVRKLPKNVEI